MRFFMILFFLTYSSFVRANEMSVDEAVTRLLNQVELEAEVIKVPIPAKEKTPTSTSSDTKSRKIGQDDVGIRTNGVYKVRRGETLDRVIRRIIPNAKIDKNVLRRAFVKANPHAFRRSNPNWLYAGSVLRIPDEDHLRQVIFKDSPAKLKKNIKDEKANWVRYP